MIMKKLKGYRLTMWINETPIVSSLIVFKTSNQGFKEGLRIRKELNNNNIKLTVFQHY